MVHDTKVLYAIDRTETMFIGQSWAQYYQDTYERRLTSQTSLLLVVSPADIKLVNIVSIQNSI